jgi:hypothetical protein
MAKVIVTKDGCWLWTGEKHARRGIKTGYGYFTVDKKRHYAHRWSYAHFVGPIPEEMTIDHKCHNADPDCSGGPCSHRSCVNPEHLGSPPGIS